MAAPTGNTERTAKNFKVLNWKRKIIWRFTTSYLYAFAYQIEQQKQQRKKQNNNSQQKKNEAKIKNVISCVRVTMIQIACWMDRLLVENGLMTDSTFF